jgi:hypothetical protein
LAVLARSQVEEEVEKMEGSLAVRATSQLEEEVVEKMEAERRCLIDLIQMIPTKYSDITRQQPQFDQVWVVERHYRPPIAFQRL